VVERGREGLREGSVELTGSEEAQEEGQGSGWCGRPRWLEVEWLGASQCMCRTESAQSRIFSPWTKLALH
jgi:hypothetical protein